MRDEWEPSRRSRSGGSGDSGASALAIACFAIFLAGGLPYGISALYPIMYHEGVLSAQRCGVERAATCLAEHRTSKCCDEQLLSFTLMSSVAMVPSDSLVAVYGEFVDRKGPRKTFVIGMLCACVGLALLAANVLLGSEILWFIAFAFLGSSGPGVFFSILFLSEKYPRLQPLIAALCSATFDASAICFYVWNACYFRLGLSLSSIATTWLALCALAALATYPRLPSWRWLKAERLRARAAVTAGYPPAGGVLERQESMDSNRSSSSRSLFESSSRSLFETTPSGSLCSSKPMGMSAAAPSMASVGGAGGVGGVGGRSTRSLLDGGVVTFGASVVQPKGHTSPPLTTISAAPAGATTPPRTGMRDDGELTDPLIAPTPPTTPNQSIALAIMGDAHGGALGDAHASVEGGGAAALPATAAACETAVPHGAPHAPHGAPHVSHAPNAGMGAPRLVDQMMRTDTLLLLLTMSCANLKATYYIVSFSDVSRQLFDEQTARQLDSLFNLAFPLGALCTSPLVSLLLRRFRKRPHAYMAIALLGQHLFGLCTLMPYVLPQALGALLFGPARTLLWGAYFHYLAQPRRYPRHLAGRTLGYSNLVLALTSDAPLYGLNLIVEHVTADGGRARRAGVYLSVHAAMQILLVLCCAFPLHLYRTRHCPAPSEARDDLSMRDSRRDSTESYGYEPPAPTSQPKAVANPEAVGSQKRGSQ